MTAPCAICGRQVAGEEHVEVTVEQVPPEERPKTYYFHPGCWSRTQSWERGL